MRSFALGFVAVMLLAPGAAQAGPPDGAVAEALFQEAERLMTAKRFDEACAKFEESNRLDPGVGVLLHLADCHEKAGRVATAWATFQLAIPPARKGGEIDRAETATKRVAALAPRLPRMVLRAPSNGPRGLTVEREGATLSSASLGVPLPIDPGKHRLTVKAPGHRAAIVEILAEEGRTLEVLLPELMVAPPEAASSKATDDPPSQPSTTPAWNAQHTIGVALAAVGLVGVGIGAGFGVKTMEDWAEVEDRCARSGDSILCDRAGAELADSAETSGWISTAGFIAGGAFMTTGAIVFLTAPWLGSSNAKERATVVPLAGPGAAGVSVVGSF